MACKFLLVSLLRMESNSLLLNVAGSAGVVNQNAYPGEVASKIYGGQSQLGSAWQLLSRPLGTPFHQLRTAERL